MGLIIFIAEQSTMSRRVISLCYPSDDIRMPYQYITDVRGADNASAWELNLRKVVGIFSGANEDIICYTSAEGTRKAWKALEAIDNTRIFEVVNVEQKGGRYSDQLRLLYSIMDLYSGPIPSGKLL